MSSLSCKTEVGSECTSYGIYLGTLDGKIPFDSPLDLSIGAIYEIEKYRRRNNKSKEDLIAWYSFVWKSTQCKGSRYVISKDL